MDSHKRFGTVGIVAASAVALFVVNLDFFAVSVALPETADSLGVTVTQLQWVVSAYLLALAAFLIVAGRLADLLGRKTWLLIGCVIFGGASLVAGAATSAELLIATRIVQGVGAAILMPVCIAVVTNAVPPEQVRRAVGMVFGVAAVGQGLGPLFGGVITDLSSWRWVYWINVPIVCVVAVLVLWVVPQSRDTSAKRRIDWVGLVLVILGIAAFTYGVDAAALHGWFAMRSLGMLLLGALVLGAFVLWQLRARPPLLALGLFRIREFSVMTLAGMVGNAAGVTTVFLATVYLQTMEGMSAMTAGFALLFFSGGVMIASQASGRLDRFASWGVMMVALAVGAAGLIVMGVSLDSTTAFLAGSLFAGLGGGLSWSFASVVTQSVVPREQAGAASGVVLTILIGVGGVVIAIAATLTAEPNTTNVARVLIALGLAELACVPLVWLLGRGGGTAR
jgi:EmrB/QacA subfamily drug resistance transporter